MGTGALLGSFVLQVILPLLFRAYLQFLNQQKEKQERGSPVHDEDTATHAFADLTDKEVSGPILNPFSTAPI